VADIHVTFFGDSICVGQYVSLHRGWVTRISAMLDAWGRDQGHRVLVTNASQNGRTTREALERIAYEVTSHRPDLVLVQYGMNDCNYWRSERGYPRVSPRSFQANLHEILERILHHGTARVFLNNNHPTTRTTDVFPDTELTYEASNRAYNQLVREVAAEAGDQVAFTDVEARFLQIVGDDPDRLADLILPAPDQLHLSEAGHDIYFELLGPKVQAAVEELAAAKGA